MLVNKVLGDGQAEPGATLGTAYHGQKYPLLHLRRDTGPVVLNFHQQHQAMTLVSNGELAQHPGTQYDPALFSHRSGCVADDIK